MANKLVVFVHGWSVTDTDTYGGLPERLKAEAEKAGGPSLDVVNIWLGKYISFHDEVRVQDISRAFDAAVRDKLGSLIDRGRRFVCVTHSTGGPVVRDWLDRYYIQKEDGPAGRCPMSHLVMLAPANFGSALAQLGKGRLFRLGKLLQGVEPGQGVLDWLELGSPESWELNRRWIGYPDLASQTQPVFLFVLTGQRINRKLYDQVNSYTGEPGSDGVVRVAAANLNATYVKLVQQGPETIRQINKQDCTGFEQPVINNSQKTAFAIIKRVSHSGKKMGIMASVPSKGKRVHPTVKALLQCIRVSTRYQYARLRGQFERDNVRIQKSEQKEREEHLFHRPRYFANDKHSMVIIRLQDDYEYPIPDFDLLFTAGSDGDANLLPEGFFKDRQRNKRHLSTITYYINHDVMAGCVELKWGQDVIRAESDGADGLGLQVQPHETGEFVRYVNAYLRAAKRQLSNFLKPNQTTMVDIVMRRIVDRNVFQLERLTDGHKPGSFKRVRPGGPIIDEGGE